MQESIDTAKHLLSNAEHVIILAGAGMSADVGIGTYWSGDNRQYGKEISRFGFTQYEHAQGKMWQTHRQEQIEFYKETLLPLVENNVLSPDSPYRLLKDYLDASEKEYYVVTSNVDAAFIRAGFNPERLFEIHGNRLRSQCLDTPQEHGVFLTDTNIGATTHCPTCNGDTRPNTLFFLDFDFNPSITNQQQDKFFAYRVSLTKGKAIVLEIGAGTTIATIRNQGLRLNRDYDSPVIRINLHELNTKGGMENIIKRSSTAPVIGLEMSSFDGLNCILT